MKMAAALLFLIAILSIVISLLLLSLVAYSHRKLKISKKETDDFYSLMKTFIDADNSFVYLKDENLKYVFVNRALENFYQRKEEELVGCDDNSPGMDDFAQSLKLTDLAVLEKETPVADEIEWKGRFYKSAKFPVRMPNGRFGVGAYISDITEEREHEKKREKDMYRHMILVDILYRSFKSTQEQLDYVLHEALKLTESQYGYIYLYDEEKREFTLNSWTRGVMEACTIPDKQSKYQLEKTGIWGEVVRQRKPMVVNDFQQANPMKKGYPKGHVELEKFMSVPVIIDEKIVAVVGLANKNSDYDDIDLYELTLLMNGVWNAKVRRENALELERTNVTIKENEARLKLLLDSTYEAIYGIDMDGNCTFCNASCLRLLGYGHQDELVGKNIHLQIHHSRKDGTALPLNECKILTALIKGESTHISDEVFWRSDGTCFDAEYFSYPQEKDGRLVGSVITFTDITSRKKAERDIIFLSYHDSLTGLYNRRLFEEEFKRLDTERNLPLSVIMGDVNGLKLTNDIFGHAYGDILLKKVAEVLRRVCRGDDIIARWGGDEFVLLLPKTDLGEAREIIERIKSEFSKENIKAVKCSISMGADVKRNIDENIVEVLHKAEERMYSAKTLERYEYGKGAIDTIITTLHENAAMEKMHSYRVSELCKKLGRALMLSEVDIRKLKEAGYYHDIGKIVMYSHIFGEDSPVNRHEWSDMKKHPIVGFRILNSFDDTVNLAELVLAHHERWDGSGYPKGLKGEEIPLPARIIALVESYDRMVSGYEGTEAMSKEEAIEEILKYTGTQFDPKLAELFIKMLAAGIKA